MGIVKPAKKCRLGVYGPPRMISQSYLGTSRDWCCIVLIFVHATCIRAVVPRDYTVLARTQRDEWCWIDDSEAVLVPPSAMADFTNGVSMLGDGSAIPAVLLY